MSEMTAERLAEIRGAADYAALRLAAQGQQSKPLNDIRDLLAEVDRLKAELAEARKDTARLDYCEGKDGRLDRILSCYFNSPEDTTYRDAIDTVADLTAPPE